MKIADRVNDECGMNQRMLNEELNGGIDHHSIPSFFMHPSLNLPYLLPRNCAISASMN